MSKETYRRKCGFFTNPLCWFGWHKWKASVLSEGDALRIFEDWDVRLACVRCPEQRAYKVKA